MNVFFISDDRDHTYRFVGRTFPKMVKEAAYKASRGHCAYCGKYLPRNRATFDHVVPYRKGGISSLENCAVACHACNIRKGKNEDVDAPYDMSVLFFRQAHRASYGKWSGYLSKNRKPILMKLLKPGRRRNNSRGRDDF